MARLSVNVDHVATLRQARRATYPDPVEAAAVAEAAGATGVTIHLRGDRRHIQVEDLTRLRHRVRGKLNLEMAASDEMIALALEHRPDQATLVPERPDEVTTEGGLDLLQHGERARAAATELRAGGIAVSIFLDPEPWQLDRLIELSGEAIEGFEINTDAYSRGRSRGELEKIAAIARSGKDRGLRVYAGHGLTAQNVGPIARLPQVEELNIGHWIVSRAVISGMREAVREMLAAMAAG